MGADLVVNHLREDVCRAMRVLAPGALDIYWETTAALECEKVLPLMAQRGRLIIVAGRGHISKFPVGPFYLRNCSMHGFTVTGTSVSDLRAYARQINAWLANQTLKARIQEIMPLADAARAHQKQEEGKLFGKIVLTPGG